MVCYLATGNARRSRDSSRAAMASALRRPATTLTLLAGDFNYVCKSDDRFTNDSLAWSGATDVDEDGSFTSLVADPFGLYELEQQDLTHASSLGRSRIDRVYVNQHVCEQLDRRIGCIALPWVPHLSAHRPLFFYRRSAKHGDFTSRPLSE